MIALSLPQTQHRQEPVIGFKDLLQAHLIALNNIRECMLTPMPESLRMKVCGLQDSLLDTVQELFIVSCTPDKLHEQHICETKLKEIIDMVIETKCLVEQHTYQLRLVTNRSAWMLGVFRPRDQFIVIG